MLQRSCEDFCLNGSCDGDTCNCSPGFSGAYCDVQLCGDQICDNNTICHIVDGAHACECLTGFMGDFCDRGKLNSTHIIIWIS